MGVIRKVLGPLSKYDKSIPYTYMAKIPGEKEIPESYYFADTICGLVEYLNGGNILPAETQIFGIYEKSEILLDNGCCTTDNDHWLLRPEICKSVENYYKNTLHEAYRGHVANGECSYDDRITDGSGPY